MATLYRRVDSKEALLQTIVDGYADRLDEAFAAVLAADAGGPAVLAERLLAITWVFAHASRHFRAESRIVALGWYGREETASPVHRYFVATEQRLHTLAELHGDAMPKDVAGLVVKEDAEYLIIDQALCQFRCAAQHLFHLQGGVHFARDFIEQQKCLGLFAGSFE